MKKLIVTLTLLSALVTAVFGQNSQVTGTGALSVDVHGYNRKFPDNQVVNRDKVLVDGRYYGAMCDEHYDAIAALGGDSTDIDLQEEWLYASYVCPELARIRPAEAAAMLPDNKESDLKLASRAQISLMPLRFLNPRSQAVGSYGIIVQTLIQKGRVSQREIDNAVSSQIAAAVDAGFNQVEFLLENARTNRVRDHISTLTRNPNGGYTLSYGGAYTNNETRTITANSLEALSSEMRNGRYKADFDATGIDTVRAQAGLIPAVVYADWKSKGFGDGMAVVKEALTNFYLRPSQDTYNAVVGIYARYSVQGATGDMFADVARKTYVRLLGSLNAGLSSSVIDNGSNVAAARIPNDARYDIFTRRFTQ